MPHRPVSHHDVGGLDGLVLKVGVVEVAADALVKGIAQLLVHLRREG
jgi:hypothetical protein